MTSFLNACGITGSLELIVDGPDTDRPGIRPLQQPFAIIGRDLRADVVLDHSQVSRRHVYLQVIEGRAFWIDLGSRTGTRIGHRSENRGWLEGGRTLGVGPYEIQLSISASQSDDSSRSLLPRNRPFIGRASSQAPSPEVALEFLNGPSRSTCWQVHRVISLIGSASGCKLRLADASVSRFHASLVQTSVGLWVVDMLGEGGVTVNSVSVRFSRLEEGDVLEIGRYHMRVQSGWQGQDTGNRAPGTRSFSTLRLQNSAPTYVKFPDRAAAAAMMGFAPGSGSPKGTEIPALVRPLSPSSSIEIMPSDGPYPVKSGQSDSAASMLVPLVNQFGLMQQQMFDQFQQAMSMLVQMFGKMHRDQMDVIRAELDKLHELTEEFQSLKDELAKRTQAQPQPVSSEPRSDPAVAAESGLSRRDILTDSSPAQTPPSQSQTTAIHRPSASSGAIPTGSKASSPLPSTSGARGDTISEQVRLSGASDPLSKWSAPPSASEQFRSAGSRSEPGRGDSDAGADTEKDTIIWLHQRIMSIQNEREGRWQKILKLLPGVS
jgi:pSer/pThr/pTyr-binding forkhead associated (FHA) protein